MNWEIVGSTGEWAGAILTLALLLNPTPSLLAAEAENATTSAVTYIQSDAMPDSIAINGILATIGTDPDDHAAIGMVAAMMGFETPQEASQFIGRLAPIKSAASRATRVRQYERVCAQPESDSYFAALDRLDEIERDGYADQAESVYAIMSANERAALDKWVEKSKQQSTYVSFDHREYFAGDIEQGENQFFAQCQSILDRLQEGGYR